MLQVFATRTNQSDSRFAYVAMELIVNNITVDRSPGGKYFSDPCNLFIWTSGLNSSAFVLLQLIPPRASLPQSAVSVTFRFRTCPVIEVDAATQDNPSARFRFPAFAQHADCCLPTTLESSCLQFHLPLVHNLSVNASDDHRSDCTTILLTQMTFQRPLPLNSVAIIFHSCARLRLPLLCTFMLFHLLPIAQSKFS